MESQTANTLLMIKPVAFGFNEQTAENNYFQQHDNIAASKIQEQALREFNQMVDMLEGKGIKVMVIEDTLVPHTPDSIFPNNWVSFHADGTVVLYPMYAENRRQERRPDILSQIEKNGFEIKNTIDYTHFEKEGMYLEGTGSMILDRENEIAYAALSERTDKSLFLKFCTDLHFTPVYFHANQTMDSKRLPIYHTNVMMCVGNNYAVVCLDSIDDKIEKETIIESLRNTNKELVVITEQQMYRFAGNMLQVENNKGEKFLVMSEAARNSLTNEQSDKLSNFNPIIAVPIPTIEKYGGGSARCMMAEVFLPKQ